jgi:hypothetical protein
MPTIVVRHKGQDFARWKRVFDAHTPVRLTAEFAASADLREAVANAGERRGQGRLVGKIRPCPRTAATLAFEGSGSVER